MSKKRAYPLETPKDVIKIIRSIFEMLILVVLLLVIVRAWQSFNVYEAFAAPSVANKDYGFIVVSYNRVTQNGNMATIGVDRFAEHLQALHESGYQTVSQQDVIDYYKKGARLPEKSLLLMVEDANRETYILAQQIMEKYNFKASILNFANGFTLDDPKLLKTDDMTKLEESTFWEIGTNGYRMEYINVFDVDGNYLGEMDTLTLTRLKKEKIISNAYDHYLMDYIRDERGLPKESYDGMVARVTGDYQKMQEAYTREIGYMPRLYAIATPNIGMFAHNNKVSAVNEACTYELFDINLNRLGYSSNNRQSSVYDLTRTQPQPFWYANHLLMRIWSDTGQPMVFTTGDANIADQWEKICGEPEFRSEEIALTTLPDGIGMLRLKSAEYSNLGVQVWLRGNRLGAQSILLRMDEAFKNGLAVTIKSNILYVNEVQEGQPQTLFSLDLNVLDGIEGESVVTSISETGSRLVDITLKGDRLTVFVDEKEAAKDIRVNVLSSGYVGLQAETGVHITNQRIPVDNIYDGVFQKLIIFDNDSKTVAYDKTPQGLEAAKLTAGKVWKSVSSWFITHM